MKHAVLGQLCEPEHLSDYPSGRSMEGSHGGLCI